MSRRGALRIKLQLFSGDERALGPGRADVLDAIEREGSISAAGRALGMSYRYTWLLVDAMNRCFTERLVETSNSGATLSAAGRTALAAYRALDKQLAEAATGEPLATLEAMLRPSTGPNA